jgi:hypothetical protein
MSLAVLRMKLRGKMIRVKRERIIIPLMNKTIQVKKNLHGDSELAELVRKCMTIRVNLLE